MYKHNNLTDIQYRYDFKQPIDVRIKLLGPFQQSPEPMSLRVEMLQLE